jgi:putative sterol carrier protein
VSTLISNFFRFSLDLLHSITQAFYHSLINIKNMTFEALTEKIKSLAAAKGGIGSSIKFATDAGNVHLTADGVVSNDDKSADCTIKVSQSDLEGLMSGDLNPMTAFMFGKLKIDGDMGVAMKLKDLF